uniref:Uncharacterized protein n=1 Tax=Ditylenchus dipsaci TaxID=166011 RepID=A0A915CL58_9BILA
MEQFERQGEVDKAALEERSVTKKRWLHTTTTIAALKAVLKSTFVSDDSSRSSLVPTKMTGVLALVYFLISGIHTF